MTKGDWAFVIGLIVLLLGVTVIIGGAVDKSLSWVFAGVAVLVVGVLAIAFGQGRGEPWDE